MRRKSTQSDIRNYTACDSHHHHHHHHHRAHEGLGVFLVP